MTSRGLRTIEVVAAALFLVACWFGPVLSVNLRTEDAVPFQIHVNAHIASAPLQLVVQARYDAKVVLGVVCLVVDGEEYHSSCWEADGAGPTLMVRRLLLEHGGNYEIQMRQVSGNGKRASNVETLLLQ